jgi:hypothetical protein
MSIKEDEIMFCGICKNDLWECTCGDIDERLASLSDVLVYPKCTACGKHMARCVCGGASA